MADVLSASSLLLAIVAVLFGAWNGVIVAAINLAMPKQVGDRGVQRSQIAVTLTSKSLPLSVGGWLIVAVFAPRAISLLEPTLAAIERGGTGFNDVSAAFVLTELFVSIVAIYATVQLAMLTAKLVSSYFN